MTKTNRLPVASIISAVSIMVVLVMGGPGSWSWSAQQNGSSGAPQESSVLRDEVLTGNFDSSVPYKVRMEGADAGFYRRGDGSTNWELIVPGEVLFAGRKGPYLVQLASTQLDDRNGALVVVDGVLRLVTTWSRPEDPSSILSIGDKDHPLYEVGTKRKVYLPKIQRSEDLSIYQHSVSSAFGFQIILVSIKGGEGFALGTGVTFALGVMLDRGASEIRLFDTPVVLDHFFREPLQLQQLIFSGADSGVGQTQVSLYSALLVEKILNLDYSRYGSHELMVRGTVEELLKPIRDPSDPHSISERTDPSLTGPLVKKVRYNFMTKKPKFSIGFEITMPFFQDQYLVQVFDPIGGEDKILLGKPGGRDPSVFEIPGLIDLDEENIWKIWKAQELLSTAIEEDEAGGAGFFSVKGEIYFSCLPEKKARSKREPLLIKLGSHFQAFGSSIFSLKSHKEFHFGVLSRAAQSRENFSLLGVLYSIQNSQTGRGMTGWHLFRRYDENVLTSLGARELLPFFTPLERMGERLYPTRGQLLFDSLTPESESLVYKGSYDPSQSHQSLFERDEKSGILWRFRAPKSKTPLLPVPGGEGVFYREYAKNSSTPYDPTGIFFSDKEGEEDSGDSQSPSVGGRLILPPSDKGESERQDQEKIFHLARFSVLLSTSDPAQKNRFSGGGAKGLRWGDATPEFVGRELYLFALDPQGGDHLGKYGYNLVVATNALDGVDQRFSPLTVRMTGDIKNFKDLKIEDIAFVQGDGEWINSGFLILPFRSGLPGEDEDHLSIVKNSKISEPTFDLYFVPIPLGKKPPETTSPIKLFSSADPNHWPTSERVLHDEQGKPYFVLSPDLPETSANYRVHDFQTGGILFPNRDPSGRRLKFTRGKSGEELLKNSAQVQMSSEDSWIPNYGEILQNTNYLDRAREMRDFDSFVHIRETLNRLSNRNQPPERVILQVPPNLKSIVWEFILGSFFSEKNSRDPDSSSQQTFSFRNIDLSIFNPQKGKQDQVFINAEFLAGQGKRRRGNRPFLLAQMGDLLKEPRPSAGDRKTFVTQELVGLSGGKREGDMTVRAETQEIIPHSLYLLAAEEPLSFDEFRRNPHPPSFSTLIVATPEEIRGLEDAAPLELSSGLLEAFRVEKIENPNDVSMREYLTRIFDETGIRNLGLKFNYQGLSSNLWKSFPQGERASGTAPLSPENFENQKDPRQELLQYAVTRFMTLASEQKQEVLESFMSFRVALASALLSDRLVRKSLVVDTSFIERVLTNVFNLPLNPLILPKDDPIRLLSEPDAILRLQEAGYTAPFNLLRQRIFKVILAQTAGDSGGGVAMPSSMILWGESGMGKTELFRALVRMLNLKLFDPHLPLENNQDASAMEIDLGQVVEDASFSSAGDNRSGSITTGSPTKVNPTRMTVAKMIENLDRFLSLPNGSRGFILLDDFTLAQDQVKTAVLNWLRGLQEAPGGRYRLPSGKKIPVRYLVPMLTLNPEAIPDKEATKSTGSDESILLASLSTKGISAKPAMLRRFGAILKVEVTEMAKIFGLMRQVSEFFKGLLSREGVLASLSSELLREIPKYRNSVDFRSLFEASKSALEDVIKRDGHGAPLVLIGRRDKSSPNPRFPPPKASGETAREALEIWIRENAQVIPVDGSIEGTLSLLRTVVDAFRLPLFELFILALQNDPRFSVEPANRSLILVPSLYAIEDHLLRNGSIPLSEFSLKPDAFGQEGLGARGHFEDHLRRHGGGSSGSGSEMRSYFPPSFGSLQQAEGGWSGLFASDFNIDSGGGPNPVEDTPVYHLDGPLGESVQRNLKILEVHLSQILGFPGSSASEERPSEIAAHRFLQSLPHSSEVTWLTTLSSPNGKALQMTGELFSRSLWDHLKKVQKDEIPVSVYTVVRLFLLSIDKAVTQLPWDSLSHFLARALKVVASDHTLRHRTEIQEFLFSNKYRLFAPAVSDLSLEMVKSSELDPPTKEIRAKWQADFVLHVQAYLHSCNETLRASSPRGEKEP